MTTAFTVITPVQAFLVAVCVTFALWLVSYLNHGQAPRKKGCVAPPGPRGLPIIGNALQFDPTMPAPQFKRWADQYGEIFYLKIGDDNMYVLNSGRLVKEALEKRSAIYSSRRPPHVAQDIVSKGKRMIFTPYGEQWRTGRKHAHALVSVKASQDNGRIWQDKESIHLLHDLLHQSENETNFVSYFRRYASSVIVNLSFGHRFPSTEDPLLNGIYHAIENVGRIAQPGNYLVDSFPVLKHLPRCLRSWEDEGEKMHKEELQVWNGHLQRLITEMQEGIAAECFVKHLLEKREGMSFEEQQASYLTDLDLAYQVCGFLEAGSDTTASAFSTLTLALALNPEVMHRAHEELDKVVGNRMPTWDDEPELPYIRAIAKEVLRWRPPGFIGTPHATTEDDILDGIFIPAGSIVVQNMWAIHHDANRYKNPEAFDPSRYLNFTKGAFQSSQEANPDDRDHFTYGAGRRLCVGIHLAEQSLFIVISRMLWAFSIERVKDTVTGEDVPLDASAETGYFKGFVTAPLPYEVKFKPRSKQVEDMLEKEFDEAVAFFKDEGREV